MSNPYLGLIGDDTKKDPKPTDKGDKTMAKGLFKSKTFWVNALTAVAGIAAFFQGSELIATNPQVVAGIGTFLGIVNVLLRLVTKEAIKGV